MPSCIATRLPKLFFCLLFCSAFAVNAPAALGQSLPAFEQILARTAKELVHVQSTERPLRKNSSYDPYFFFMQESLPQGRKVYPLASGFILPDGAHCVSSFRALEGADGLQVVTAAQKTWSAELVGADPALDLAVLRIKDAKGLSGVDFVAGDKAILGEAVVAMARPLGFKPLIKRGFVSSGSDVLGGGVYNRHWLLDFISSPALSGGPVIDSRGRVVGMAVYNPSGPPDFGFLLPAHLLQQSVAQILKTGKVHRAWLGLVPRNLVSVDEMDALRNDDIKGGVLIENLIVDGPAARAGMQIGDLIMQAGTASIRSISELEDWLAKEQSGEKQPFQVYRSKKGPVTVTVQLGEMPSAQDLPLTKNLL